MPTLEDIERVCHERGCAVTRRGRATLSVPLLTHIEDAQPGTLSWLRGRRPETFRGDALITHQRDARDRWARSAKLLAASEDPRGVMRALIEQLGYAERTRPLVKMGLNCTLHESAVVGADGQGYDWAGDHYDAFPHAGGVRFGAGVEVGPGTTIMRGSVGDTVIGAGTKIGNQVNIGHDVRIGYDCLIVAGAKIAGWVRIGDNVKIWMGALIKNGVTIGDGAVIGMGAVVLTDVPAGEVWSGHPAEKVG